MSQRIPEFPKYIANDYSRDLLHAQLSHVAYADRAELHAALNGGFRKPEYELPPNWRPLLDEPFGHCERAGSLLDSRSSPQGASA